MSSSSYTFPVVSSGTHNGCCTAGSGVSASTKLDLYPLYARVVDLKAVPGLRKSARVGSTYPLTAGMDVYAAAE